MRIQILLFASARERLKRESIHLEVSAPPTLSQLRAWVEEEHPLLKGLKGRWAVNREFARNEKVIVREGDEIAWIPPVCGG